jgi:cyanophycinase
MRVARLTSVLAAILLLTLYWTPSLTGQGATQTGAGQQGTQRQGGAAGQRQGGAATGQRQGGARGNAAAAGEEGAPAVTLDGIARAAAAAKAVDPSTLEYGPSKGTLIIIGGGNANGTGLMEKFIELAGGAENGKFVIIPTNGGNRNPDGTLKTYDPETVLRPWKGGTRNLKNVVMLHTADPKVADTEEFVKPLLDATGVWFDGGRQWNMVDSYKGTRTEREIKNVLARGGVTCGSSAGATIQGEYLWRGDTTGPNVLMSTEPNHQLAFGLLKNVAIDQHINTRNRWWDLEELMKAVPNKYLGIGLSEGTGIIVNGDRFEVMGRWKVAIHDATYAHQPWDMPWYVLSQGDVYNMRTRKVEKYGMGQIVPQAMPGRGRGGGGN